LGEREEEGRKEEETEKEIERGVVSIRREVVKRSGREERLEESNTQRVVCQLSLCHKVAAIVCLEWELSRFWSCSEELSESGSWPTGSEMTGREFTPMWASKDSLGASVIQRGRRLRPGCPCQPRGCANVPKHTRPVPGPSEHLFDSIQSGSINVKYLKTET
jgi:hypothetical protein